jgi:hypothetical protein
MPTAPMIGHVVTLPDRSPHRALKMSDSIFLLMDALTSLRRGARVVIVEPFSPPSLCSQCQEAYTEARRAVKAAGGLTTWAEAVWAGAATLPDDD